MRVLETGPDVCEKIERYASHGACSAHLGTGEGASHVYAIHFDAGGEIGPHEAGFDQLFVVVEGAGWVAGADGARTDLALGQVAQFRRGELHSKGSEQGMKALMIQIAALSTSGTF